MKLSVAIMADRRREPFVHELLPQLPGADVTWDERGDRWHTGQRAMLAHDPDADFHLVVQDDALPCRDFLPGVRAALHHVPGVPVSFYTGNARPLSRAVSAAVMLARRGRKPFLAMRGPLWGVAVAVPVPLIEPMLEGCEALDIANYDLRMARWFETGGIECWYTLPSLVDHRVGPENPSLVPGRGAAPSRTAHEWLGRRSPLEIDWSRGALRILGGSPLAINRQSTTDATLEGRAVRIRYMRSMGRARGPSIMPGDELDVSVAAAERLIRKGFAEEVRSPSSLPELTTLPMRELRELAKERGIGAPVGITKVELAKSLSAAED